MSFWDDWYTSARDGVGGTVKGAENFVGSLFTGPSTEVVDPNEVYGPAGKAVYNPVTGQYSPLKVTTAYGENAPTFFQGVEIENATTGQTTETYGPSAASVALDTIKEKVNNAVKALPKFGDFLKSALVKTLLVLLVVVLAAIFVYGYARSR